MTLIRVSVTRGVTRGLRGAHGACPNLGHILDGLHRLPPPPRVRAQVPGYCLMCPSCCQKFLTIEVQPPPEAEGATPAPSTKKPKTEELEMTLAEMQLDAKFLAIEVLPPPEAEGATPAPPTKKPKMEELEMTLVEIPLEPSSSRRRVRSCRTRGSMW
jgi:hypothetical protein